MPKTKGTAERIRRAHPGGRARKCLAALGGFALGATIYLVLLLGASGGSHNAAAHDYDHITRAQHAMHIKAHDYD